MYKDENGKFKLRLKKDKVTKNNKWRYNDYEGHVLYLAPSEYQMLKNPTHIDVTVEAHKGGQNGKVES